MRLELENRVLQGAGDDKRNVDFMAVKSAARKARQKARKRIRARRNPRQPVQLELVLRGKVHAGRTIQRDAAADGAET